MTGSEPGQPKLFCAGWNTRTKEQTHRKRTLAVYFLRDHGFSLLQNAGRDKDPVNIIWPPLAPTTTKKSEDPTIEFLCVTCRRNMRFKASDLDVFLRADTGSVHKNAAIFAATLS